MKQLAAIIAATLLPVAASAQTTLARYQTPITWA